MKNKLISFLLSFIFLYSLEAKEWSLKSIDFTFEDDLFYQTDCFYTYGSKLLFLFQREKRGEYISFAFTNKMYTPEDLEAKEPIYNDVAYAGYINVETALYERENNQLSTYVFQLGLIGPETRMDRLQIFMHQLTSSDIPKGWDNQLNNEVTFQVNYNKKYRYSYEKNIFGSDSVLIPEYGFDLGNVSTRIYAGMMFRVGNAKAMQNFGAYAIDNSPYGKIPFSEGQNYEKQFHFCLNLGMKFNGIAQDIFLDGNTNTGSHSVEKKHYTANILYGFSLTYNRFSIDWIHTYTTKQYIAQPSPHLYTSFQILYHY